MQAKHPNVCAEWKLYVEPELRRLFEGATETVERDLQQLGDQEKPFANCTLRIPVEHSEAWLNALNQARLALAAKYDFTEAELCDHYRSPIGSRRDLSLFQVNFYGFLQEFILRETGMRQFRTTDQRERSLTSRAAAFLVADHLHQALFQSVGRFRRPQAQGECFVQPITLGDEIFRLLPELLARASSNSRLSPFSSAPMT